MNLPALKREPVTFRRMSFKDGDFAKLWEFHQFLFVGDMVGIVAEHGGRIIGCGMFNTFQKGSCWMHLWVADPIAFHDGLLYHCAKLIYDDIGVHKILARLIESNTKIIKCANRGGFQFLFRIKDGADIGDDYLIYEMTREDCKALTENK